MKYLAIINSDYPGVKIEDSNENTHTAVVVNSDAIDSVGMFEDGEVYIQTNEEVYYFTSNVPQQTQQVFAWILKQLGEAKY